MSVIRLALRNNRRDRQRLLCHLGEKHVSTAPTPSPSHEESWMHEARRTTEATQILQLSKRPVLRPSRRPLPSP